VPGLSHRFHAEMTLVLFGLRFGDCVLNRTSATDAIHFPRGEAGTFKSHWEGVQTLRAGNRNLRFPWGSIPLRSFQTGGLVQSGTEVRRFI
jgi:hypothetical protein